MSTPEVSWGLCPPLPQSMAKKDQNSDLLASGTACHRQEADGPSFLSREISYLFHTYYSLKENQGKTHIA
jgi:hypothetical protein